MCVSKENGKYIWVKQNREFNFLGSFVPGAPLIEKILGE